MENIEGTLHTLAQVFITFAGFAGVIDLFQRQNDTRYAEEKIIGLRLSLRLGLYGTLLSILPTTLYGARLSEVSLEPNTVWTISIIAFISLIAVELWNAYLEAVHREPINRFLTITGVIIGVAIIITFVIFILFIHSYLPTVYLISLGIVMSFSFGHFIVYTHRNPSELNETK